MKLFSKILFSILFVLVTFSHASAFNRENVKSGKSKIIYRYTLKGEIPPNIAKVEPSYHQPPNGTFSVKKVVKGTGIFKTTIFRFSYTSKKGFKGIDKGRVGLEFTSPTGQTRRNLTTIVLSVR